MEEQPVAPRTATVCLGVKNLPSRYSPSSWSITCGELNTVAVFVSLLLWGGMWGSWGLVLAVPITVAVKAAADRIEPLQPLGELLARSPAVSD